MRAQVSGSKCQVSGIKSDAARWEAMRVVVVGKPKPWAVEAVMEQLAECGRLLAEDGMRKAEDKMRKAEGRVAVEAG